MAIGLINQATIKVDVQYSGANLKDLKNALLAATKAINVQNMQKQFEALGDSIQEARRDMVAMKQEMEQHRNSVRQAEEATKKLEETQRRLKSMMKDLYSRGLREGARSVTQAVKEQTVVTREATYGLRDYGKVAKSAYVFPVDKIKESIAQKRRERAAIDSLITGLRALGAARQQAAMAIAATSPAAMVAGMRAIGAARQQAAMVAAAASPAAIVAGIRAVSAARQEEAMRIAQTTAAQQRESAARKAAHAETRRQQLFMAMLSVAYKENNQFQVKNAQLINQIRNARNADIATLQKYAAALRVALNVEKQRQGVLAGTSPTGAKMGFIDTLKARLSEYEKQVDALFRASYRLTMVGHTLQRFSQNILRVGNDIMNTFEEFEFMMNRARGALEIWSGATLNGADATQVLQQELLDLSAELRIFPAQEVAQGLYFWGSATGQVVDDVRDLRVAMDALNPIMKVAAMTNTSYEQTIKGVFSILTQYYAGSLDKAEEVTQKLFLTTQKTAAEFTDLIQAFKMVGPVASQAGATFDEVNEVMGRLSDLGLRGTMAGRGLRQLFIQMVRPSGPALKAINNLWGRVSPKEFGGKDFFETTFPEGEFTGIINHMKNLAKATRNLTFEERGRFLAQISTANMLPLVTALVAQQTREMNGLADAEKDYSTSAQKAAEFFEKNWDLLQNSWKGVESTVTRAVEALRIHIGSLMADALKPLMEFVRQVIDSFTRFVKANPELVAAIGQITAAIAAISAVGGGVFIVMGALTGLGAAISLTVKSFGKWAGTISATVVGLGLLFKAVTDNFDYLKVTAVSIIENLTSAFGEAETSIHSIGEAFFAILRPAQEIMSLFVRMAADLAVRISELVAWFMKLDFAPGLLENLGKAIGILVSARIISGILTLGLAIKSFLAASIIARIAVFRKSWGLMMLQMDRAKLTGAARGINMLKVGISGLLGGGLGMIAMAATIGILAYDNIDPLREAVDNVSRSFADWRQNLQKTTTELGEMGEPLRRMTIRWQGIEFDTSDWRRAEQQKAKAIAGHTAELRELLEVPESMSAEQFDAISGASVGAIQDPARRKKAEWLWKAIQTNTETRARDLAKIEQILEDSAESSEASIERIKGSYKEYFDTATQAGLEFVRTQDQFFSSLIGLSANQVDPELGREMLERIFFSMPEFVDLDYISNWLSSQQRLVSLGGGDEITRAIASLWPHQLASIIGDSFGIASSAVNAELERAVQKAFQMEDPAEIAAFLNTKLEGYSLSIAEMIGRPEFAAIEPMLQQAFEHLAVQTEEWAAGNVGLKTIETRLQNTYTKMVEDFAAAAMPEIGNLSDTLNNLMWNGPGGYESMAEELLKATTLDGGSLLEAVSSGTIPGTAASTILQIAQFIVENSLGGEFQDQLVAIVKDESSEVAEETANRSRKAIQESIMSAFDSRLTKKAILEAFKKGSTKSQFGKMISELGGKLMRQAFEGPRANMQSRSAARGRVNQILSASMDNLFLAAGSAREQKVENRFIRRMAAALPNMPEAVKKALEIKLRELVGMEILTPEQARRIIPDIVLPMPKITFDSDAETAMRNMISGIFGGITPDRGGGKLGGAQSYFGNAFGPGVVAEMAQSIENADASAITTAGEKKGKKVGKGVQQGIRSKKEAMANTMSATLSAASGIAATKNLGSKGLADKWVEGVSAAINNGTGAVKGAIALNIATASSGMEEPARSWGNSIGAAWAGGIVSGIKSKQEDIDAAISAATPSLGPTGSPPKEGPLRHVDTWGMNIGSAWVGGIVEGIRQNKGRVSREMRLDREFREGSVEVTANNKKEVRVKIEVTSPDGSVDRVKKAEIRRSVLEALTIADLEHMVTVS